MWINLTIQLIIVSILTVLPSQFIIRQHFGFLKVKVRHNFGFKDNVVELGQVFAC